MSSIYNEKAPKKPANCTVNSDLLAQAKLLHINISMVLEFALAEAVKRKKSENWLADNSEAISDYNAMVSRSGLFSEELRTF